MKPLAYLAVFSALLINSSVVALPQTQNTRQYNVNCTNERAITDASCWNTLKVADYLASWSWTTPDCTGTTPNGVGCCISDEPWSTCFIRLGTGTAGFSCSSMSRTFCGGSAPLARENLPPNIRPQVTYVLRSIWAVHQFLTSYDEGECPYQRC